MMVARENKIILFMKLAVHASFEMMVCKLQFVSGIFFGFLSSYFFIQGQKLVWNSVMQEPVFLGNSK